VEHIECRPGIMVEDGKIGGDKKCMDIMAMDMAPGSVGVAGAAGAAVEDWDMEEDLDTAPLWVIAHGQVCPEAGDGCIPMACLTGLTGATDMVTTLKAHQELIPCMGNIPYKVNMHSNKSQWTKKLLWKMRRNFWKKG